MKEEHDGSQRTENAVLAGQCVLPVTVVRTDFDYQHSKTSARLMRRRIEEAIGAPQLCRVRPSWLQSPGRKEVVARSSVSSSQDIWSRWSSQVPRVHNILLITRYDLVFLSSDL